MPDCVCGGFESVGEGDAGWEGVGVPRVGEGDSGGGAATLCCWLSRSRRRRTVTLAVSVGTSSPSPSPSTWCWCSGSMFDCSFQVSFSK